MVPDIFETEGMRLANGQVIYTDPEMMDTDCDGLEDGIEINCKMSFNKDDTLEELLEEYSLGELVDACYFKMSSNPTLKDSDGDGIDDDEENEKDRLIFNRQGIVFYDNTEFSRQGKDECEYLKNSDPSLVIRDVPINSKNDFVYYWNLYSDVNADISLVVHGSPSHIWLVDDNLLVDEISNLNKAEINNLRILACNCGHKDISDNVANAFKQYHNINHLFAMDGNISYYPSVIGSLGFGKYKPRLSTAQSGFNKYASKEVVFVNPIIGWIEVNRSPVGLYEVI